jgi:hypothetical protein
MRVLGTPMISSDAFQPYAEMMRWTKLQKGEK